MLKSLFGKMFLSYSGIFLVPLFTMALLSYWWVSNIVTEQTKSSYEVMIEEVKNSVDNRFEELNALSLQLSHAPWVKKFMYMQGDDINTDRVYATELTDHVMELRGYEAFNDFISLIAIVFPEKNIVVSSVGTANADIFFNELYKADQMDYDNWKEIFRTNKQPKVIVLNSLYYIHSLYPNNPPTKTLMYIQPLPSMDQKSHAVLITFIKREALANALKKLQIASGTSIYLTDDKDNQVMSINVQDDSILSTLSSKYGDSGNIAGNVANVNGKHFIFRKVSSNNGWKYTSIIPYKIVMSKVEYIKTVTIVLAVVLLIIGLLISYFFAVHNYNPLQKLVSFIIDRFYQKKNPNLNEYDLIQTTLHSLINEENYLKGLIQKRNPLMKSACLIKLLNSDIESAELSIEMLTSLGISFPFSMYVTGIFTFEGAVLINEDIQNKILDKLCKYDSKIYFININEFKKAIIINFKQNDNLKELILLLREQLERELGAISTVGIGMPYDTMNDLSKSYIEALTAMDYRLIRDNNEVIFFEDIKKETTIYYYPIDKERQIINALRAVEYDNVVNIIREVIQHNTEANRLSIYGARCLFYNLMGTALKAINDLDVTDEIKIDDDKINALDTLTEIEEYLKELYKRICCVIDSKKKNQNDTLKNTIKQYMETNYNNQNLTLEIIADDLGVSISYLSKFFKENFEYTFLEYLNRMRIERAKKLLDGEITVIEVAQAVGYNNDVTFRRVFKKYEGITPGKYSTV